MERVEDFENENAEELGELEPLDLEEDEPEVVEPLEEDEPDEAPEESLNAIKEEGTPSEDIHVQEIQSSVESMSLDPTKEQTEPQEPIEQDPPKPAKPLYASLPELPKLTLGI